MKRSARKVWILNYHALDSVEHPVAVDDPADLSVVVGADNFRQQLRCLAELGKTIVSLESIVAPDDAVVDGDPVVLTFDDGHRSNWSLALPELLEAGAVATFYVVAGFVDKDPEYLTSAQLRELAADNMLIGSHGMTHRFLCELGPQDLRMELANSRARLEDILGRPVLDLALPGGHGNRAVFDEARSCGYRSVATCKVGVHRLGQKPFRLPRLEVRRGLSMDGFRNTFARSKLFQLRIFESAKACLRATCGLSGYTKIRRVAHRYMTINR